VSWQRRDVASGWATTAVWAQIGSLVDRADTLGRLELLRVSTLRRRHILFLRLFAVIRRNLRCRRTFPDKLWSASSLLEGPGVRCSRVYLRRVRLETLSYCLLRELASRLLRSESFWLPAVNGGSVSYHWSLAAHPDVRVDLRKDWFVVLAPLTLVSGCFATFVGHLELSVWGSSRTSSRWRVGCSSQGSQPLTLVASFPSARDRVDLDWIGLLWFATLQWIIIIIIPFSCLVWAHRSIIRQNLISFFCLPLVAAIKRSLLSCCDPHLSHRTSSVSLMFTRL